MGKRKKGKGKSAKKAAVGQSGPGSTSKLDKSPHTFVFQRGQVGKNIRELISDMRALMEPFTASNLKVRKKNVLKDFVGVAGLLHVTHFMIFTKTENTINLRVCRLPHGPTLHFRLEGYSLRRDVVSSLKKQHSTAGLFDHHPLLVVNGLSGEGLHFKLMASMFQNMFPSIDIAKVKLSTVRRCVLLNYNQENDCLELRHYNIRVVPVGLSRGVKKLVKKKKDIPNLSKFKDMTEFLERAGDMSESEAEMDGPDNEVNVSSEMTGGPVKPGKSAIRLTEIGPRIRLKLVKIEEGFCSGNVLYHHFVEKSEEDLKALAKFKQEKKKVKDQRRRKQEENVRNKAEQKEMIKIKTLAGMKKSAAANEDGATNAADDEDDDVEYYKQEVGEEPEKELFLKSKSKFNAKGPRKRPHRNENPNAKKTKYDSNRSNQQHNKQDAARKKFKQNDGNERRGGPNKNNKGNKGPKTELDMMNMRKKKKLAKQKTKAKKVPFAKRKM